MNELVVQLLTAAKQYDRDAANTLVDAIAANAGSIGFEDAKKAMQAVRNQAWFDLLERIGAAFVARPEITAPVQRLYAQALIELGRLDEAMEFLLRLIQECASDEREYNEARGLLGRTYKQAYVNGRGDEWLHAAIRQYDEVYQEKPKRNFWHGINAVALLALAERRNLPMDVQRDYREMARDIRSTIDDLAAENSAETWDYASAAEASVALREWDAAGDWLRRYLNRVGKDAFAVGSTLRQFEQVWELGDVPAAEPAMLLYLLKAGLFAGHGGDTITVQTPSEEQRRFLQKIHGKEPYIPGEELELGLLRGRNVARISTHAGSPLGTGFFLPAKDLDPKLDGWLLLTNTHVMPQNGWNSVVVVFLSAQPRRKYKYRVQEMLWTSPETELDACILRLEVDSIPEITEPYPIVRDIPPVADDARIYIVGYPKGGEIQFSISDNILLDHEEPKMHYRTPTDEGSSGSPAFYGDEWELVALHRAGGKDVPRLKGQAGTYAANEGIFIGSIINAFQHR